MNASDTVVSAGLAYLPIIAWLAFFYRGDRRREPKRAVAIMFLLGMAATVPAAVFNRAWAELILDSRFVSNELLASAALTVFLFTLAVAFTEETLKVGVAWIGLPKSVVDEPIDIIVYFTAAALGFAAAENFDWILRTFNGAMGGGLGAVGSLRAAGITAGERALFNTLGHVAWTATVGYMYAMHIMRGRGRHWIVFGFAAAVALHTFSNVSSLYALRVIRDNSYALQVTNDPKVVEFVALLPSLLANIALLLFIWRQVRRYQRLEESSELSMGHG